MSVNGSSIFPSGWWGYNTHDGITKDQSQQTERWWFGSKVNKQESEQNYEAAITTSINALTTKIQTLTTCSHHANSCWWFQQGQVRGRVHTSLVLSGWTQNPGVLTNHLAKMKNNKWEDMIKKRAYSVGMIYLMDIATKDHIGPCQWGLYNHTLLWRVLVSD